VASLKIKNGNKKEVLKGKVEIEGTCVVLYEFNPKTGGRRMVYGYCLLPGETVTKGEGDDYIVEF
jgi:hypothetical protein